VKPYFYTYHVFAKGRWFGKALVDILTSDYKTYTREYNVRGYVLQLLTTNITGKSDIGGQSEAQRQAGETGRYCEGAPGNNTRSTPP
jgi:hypothetical protein